MKTKTKKTARKTKPARRARPAAKRSRVSSKAAPEKPVPAKAKTAAALKILRGLVKQQPRALRRLGKSIFVKVPLYEAKRRYSCAYVNRALFERLVPGSGSLSTAEMGEAVAAAFNTTIEPKNGTGKRAGFAYADRQYDPLNLSLSGNEGSGRAYYAGSVFNVKGEKTPLAKSKQRRFSDGLLEMERAIWETQIANALQGSISTGLSEVLAILDLNEQCNVIWRDHTVKRAKIIRVDESGALDRVTHLFRRKRPLSAKRLSATARAYGRLEADKFAERILHGSWSAGNISLDGHLIDFDTVCALKGRAPQYSFTRWHYHNYFGHEIHGQLEILKALAADRRVNAGKTPFEALKTEAQEALRERLLARFAGLMGFTDVERLSHHYRRELEPLVALWGELARKTYKKPDYLSVKTAPSALMHVFDFSALFRAYPLQRRLGRFTPEAAIHLMTGNTLLKDPLREEPDACPMDLPVQREHRDRVHGVIGEHFVTAREHFQLLQIATLSFVKKYDALHRKITTETHADPLDLERRAWLVNEDRLYMFPSYTASFALAEHAPPFAPQTLQGLIEGLILAGARDNGHQLSDIRLFELGILFTLLDGRGFHRIGFSFFDADTLANTVSISAKNSKYKLSGKEDVPALPHTLWSPKTDNSELLAHFNRESCLHISKWEIAFPRQRPLPLKEILQS
jgi:hypothetical protein